MILLDVALLSMQRFLAVCTATLAYWICLAAICPTQAIVRVSPEEIERTYNLTVKAHLDSLRSSGREVKGVPGKP